MRTLLAFLLLASVALADPPKAVINGPTEAMPGDFIDLDASASVGDFFEWKVDPPQFKDGRKTYRFPKGADGTPPEPQKSKECGIASRSGKYSVTLIVANEEGISVATWTVTVFETPAGTPAPQPQPNPTPAPVPAPPANPSPSGLSDWVYQQAITLVPAEGRAAVASKLADSYRRYAVVGTAAAKSPAEFAKGQAMLNQAILLITGSGAKWDPFLQALAGKLAALNMTIPQQQQAWYEIAAGLERLQ